MVSIENRITAHEARTIAEKSISETDKDHLAKIYSGIKTRSMGGGRDLLTPLTSSNRLCQILESDGYTVVLQTDFRDGNSCYISW